MATKRKKASKNNHRTYLTNAERELVLKACRRYRYVFPPYLKSSEPEISAVDSIIRKLS